MREREFILFANRDQTKGAIELKHPDNELKLTNQHRPRTGFVPEETASALAIVCFHVLCGGGV